MLLILIVIVFILQAIAFILTLTWAISFARLFPKKDIWEVRKENQHKEILLTKVYDSEELKNILDYINNYIASCGGTVPDFNIVKDIIERHVDNFEEKINNFLTVPLFLGLVGTIIGIILGLGDVDIDNEKFVYELTGHVKFAMIASLIGLILTVINSAIIFNTAKNKMGYRRNIFYDFLHSQKAENLFPSVSGNLENVLRNMHQNLEQFNCSLGNNLKKFEEVFSNNKELIDSNKELIDALRNSSVLNNMKEIVGYNSKVSEEMNATFKNLDDFNKYIYIITELVKKLGSFEPITEGTVSLSKAANNLNVLAENINKNVIENTDLVNFLKTHLESIGKLSDDAKKAVEKANADVSSMLAKQHNELFDSLQSLTGNIKFFDKIVKESLDEKLAPVSGRMQATFEGLEQITKNFETIVKKALESEMTGYAAQVAQPIKDSFKSILEFTQQLEENINETEVKEWVNAKLENWGKEVEEKLQNVIANASQNSTLQSSDLEKSVKELNNIMNKSVNIQEEIYNDRKPRSLWRLIFYR
ncbi:MAG: MotA/TolQ/ExbB proton channel family protein [Fibromonadales bacterium]|nr:MotA/TolQ/ExbB proton channel family protein [Fibromonadales bacterium]